MAKVISLAICFFFTNPFVPTGEGERASRTLLVESTESGEIVCGLATRFSRIRQKTIIELPDSLDGKKVQVLLAERHSDWQISLDKKKLIFTGLPYKEVVQRLLVIEVAPKPRASSDTDVLGDLATMAAPLVAGGFPESGGSIRASKSVEIGESETREPGVASRTAAGLVAREHDPRERWVGEVIYLKRLAFPEVSIKLRVKAGPQRGPNKKMFRKGRVLTLKVFYPSKEGSVDFQDLRTQQNLVAYYLNPGDRIALHATIDGDEQIQADWLERKVSSFSPAKRR